MHVGAILGGTQVTGEDDTPRRQLRELGVGEPDEDAVRARARFEARDDRARRRPFFRIRAEADGHVAAARIGGHVASVRKTADARVAAGAEVDRLAPRRLQRRRFRNAAFGLDIPHARQRDGKEEGGHPHGFSCAPSSTARRSQGRRRRIPERSQGCVPAIRSSC